MKQCCCANNMDSDMGKRSNFERIENDFYETPIEAFYALIPHLPKCNFILVDPCAGEHKIIKHLRDLMDNGIAYYPYDYCPEDYEAQSKQADAQSAKYFETAFFNSYDVILTNPPWDRRVKDENGKLLPTDQQLLHRIIDNCSSQAPTWLLFDADWMHTVQSEEYMKYCHKIVSVGRLKWFPNTKTVGKDNCAWYLFDQTKVNRGTRFYSRIENGKN